MVTQYRKTYVAAFLTILCLLIIGCKKKTDGESDNAEDKPTGTEPDDKDSYQYTGRNAVYLEQGWNEPERERFYYLGQGSQLLPYSWFLCLELAKSDELVRSDRHMASLGFIPQPPTNDRNPDGLPIGFAIDRTLSTFAMKSAFLGGDYNPAHYPNESEWLGLTCAACHTADLVHNNKLIRIDGGAALADVESFLAALAASMNSTASDDKKFATFAERLQERSGIGEDGAVPSRQEFASYAAAIEQLVARNKGSHPYGLARLDAFGAILNQITAGALGIPENRRPSSAPTSYPFLWDTPHLDWVQWISSAEIPTARNVGEVLGVFAHFEPTGNPATGYASSARLDLLHELEVSLRALKAPPWPSEHFGKIDTAKADAGKILFHDNCADCHNVRDDEGNFQMTSPNEAGNSYIKTTSIPYDMIGTDRQVILNIASRTAKPGVLASAIAGDLEKFKESGGLERLTELRAKMGLAAPDLSQEVPASLLLKAAVRGVIQRYMAENFASRTPAEVAGIMLEMRGGRPTDRTPPNGGTGYKARPLNGVWATAPFLHNGSVPSLWELLKPEKDRIKSFHVSREFDPTHVGVKTGEIPGSFHFQTVANDGTAIPGNSNLGHSGDRHTETGGVPFSDAQRWAIIEYIKTLE